MSKKKTEHEEATCYYCRNGYYHPVTLSSAKKQDLRQAMRGFVSEGPNTPYERKRIVEDLAEHYHVSTSTIYRLTKAERGGRVR